jgi:membrane-bound metal-dependent hydrolase YbcI (DUF457 family)
MVHRLFNLRTLAVGVIIAGSMLPDFDVFWHSHRGWTHNLAIPVSILFCMGFTYFGGQGKVGVLK